jgi:hypothetical protein
MRRGIDNLRLDALRAKLELNWIQAASLMNDLENCTLTSAEKCATSRRWLEVTREGDLLAFALDLVRRQQKESIGSRCKPKPWVEVVLRKPPKA